MTFIVGTTACGRRPGQLARESAPPAVRLPPPLPLDQVFVLESSGGPPEDSVVTIRAGQRRVVVMRRTAPDNSLFARLEFPAGSLVPLAGDSVRLGLRPRAGLYGLDLEADGSIGAGATVTFSYAVHFVAPAGARTRYGSDLGFERQLLVGMVGSDNRVTFLPTARPGSDMVSAPVPGPGRFLVAAPR